MSYKWKILSFFLFLFLWTSGAQAQSNCTTANYYNSLFHPGCLSWTDLNNSWSSPPVLGSVKPNDANIKNLTVTGNINLITPLQTTPSVAAGAGFIIPPGVTPSAPTNGSLWTTSAGLFVQINGGTLGPLGGGGGGGATPGGSTNAVQYNAGGGNLGGATLTTAQILLGQVSGAPLGQTMSGDCTITALGVITCTKTSGSTLGALALLSLATVPVGGTGLTAGTSGGVPYFSATNAMTSSALLTNNALMMGGGAGAAPKTPLGLGTSVQTLHGNAGGAPTWGAVALGTDVTGNLAVSNLNGGASASSSTFWRGDGTWAAATGGGASWNITDGTNSVAAVTSLTVKSLVVSGSAGNATIAPTASNATKTANYSVATGDMGGVLNFNNTNLTMTIPAISSTVFASGMQLSVCNFHSTAVTISTTPTINGYPSSIPGVVNGVANCVSFTSNGTSLDAYPAHYILHQLQDNVVAQTFTGGIRPTAFGIGTVTTGTTNVDCGNGPIQTMTNGGASTLAMSANDGSCVLRMTNNGSAGAITFSGFSQGSNSGDSLTTTNASKFDVYLNRIGGNPHYNISALQ